MVLPNAHFHICFDVPSLIFADWTKWKGNAHQWKYDASNVFFSKDSSDEQNALDVL